MVLAIVGVVTGVTVLGLGALDRGARAETEAMRLADRMQLASDAALVSSAVFALVWDAGGYRFDRWDPTAGVWIQTGQGLLGPRHTLPSALRLQRGAGSGTPPVLIAPDLPQAPVEFVITGGATPWAVGFDGFAAAASPVQGAGWLRRSDARLQPDRGADRPGRPRAVGDLAARRHRGACRAHRRTGIPRPCPVRRREPPGRARTRPRERRGAHGAARPRVQHRRGAQPHRRP